MCRPMDSLSPSCIHYFTPLPQVLTVIQCASICKNSDYTEMLKVENNTGKDGEDTRNNWARTCDTCRSAACTVYCRADMAYLCTSCDARIHAANQVASRHERVWVCESCERAPAAFLCKADAASLCTSCDSDIHSANPLARRHHRVPILPIPGMLYGPSAADPSGLITGATGDADDEFLTQEADDTIDEEDENEAASWLLLNPMKNRDHQSNDKMLFGEEVDEYFDLDEYNPCQNNQFNEQYNNQQQHYNVPQRSYGGDSVVPNQKEKDQAHHHFFQFGLEYKGSNLGYNYPTSVSHGVSLSPVDVGVVPESCEISGSHTRPPKGTIDLFSGPPIQMPTQLTPMDRKARVLRYREKKKARKFEKTIRYASRKAYAETRPRIKGRFAKRTNVEVEVDQMFSTSLIAESAYGIVPSF